MMTKVPVNVVDGEGFGEEDEGENNTDSFSEGGHSDREEGSKLPHKPKHNLRNRQYDKVSSLIKLFTQTYIYIYINMT